MTNETVKSNKKSLFHTILGFTQSRLGPLGDSKPFVQKVPG